MMVEGIEVDGFMAICLLVLVFCAACIFVWVVM